MFNASHGTDLLADSELHELAAQALLDRFYLEFSDLVLKYQAAARGLHCGPGSFDRRLQEQGNPYSSKHAYDAAKLFSGLGTLDDYPEIARVLDVASLQIKVVQEDGDETSCSTMREAITQQGHRITLNDRIAFEWRDTIGWYWAGMNEEGHPAPAEARPKGE